MGSVFLSMVYQSSEVSHYVHAVKKLYAGMDLKPKSGFEAGESPYPPPGEKSHEGMHMELR